MINQVNDKALQKFADLMVRKIEEIENDHKIPWFSSVGYGLPQNLEGRAYNGINLFMLFLLQAENKYHTPVYMTFLQAKEQGIKINKGASSFPVVYWNMSIKDDDGKSISMTEYKSLNDDEKQKYTVYPYTKVYPVFNVDQTNFAEVYPKRWKELQQKFGIQELKDERGMFCSPELDHMLKHGKWLCPIVSTFSDNAFYLSTEDKIYLPLKGQFDSGEKFYSILLHEMAHSTGIELRLGRELKNTYGDPKYAKEELIAELTAAVSCQSLGIVSRIQEENAQYLKRWLGIIKKEPNFLFSILADVGKASAMILNEVCREQQKKIEQAQEEKKEVIEEKKQCSDIHNKEGLSPAFKLAVSAAIAGSFQSLIDLKNQGYKPSSEEIGILKNSSQKVYIATQTIFNIKSELPTLSSNVLDSCSKKDEKQLTLKL